MKENENVRLFLVSLELSAILGLVLTLGICVMGKTTKISTIVIMFLLTTAVLTAALYIRMRIERKRQKAREAQQQALKDSQNLHGSEDMENLPDTQDPQDTQDLPDP